MFNKSNKKSGINIFSQATTYQYLAFGHPTAANRAYVRYYHTDDRMNLLYHYYY